MLEQLSLQQRYDLLPVLDDGECPHDEKLDAGIAAVVNLLRHEGIETYESCQGGPGHSYLMPTVRFLGDHSESFRALAVVIRAGVPVDELHRLWSIIDNEPTGPSWELTFCKTMEGATYHD